MRTTTSSPRDDVRATRTTTGPGLPAARTRRAGLPGDPQAAAAARRFARSAFAEWAAQRLPGTERFTDRLVDEAVLLVSELVTNAVVHAGTTIELRCRLDPAAEPEPGAEPDPDDVPVPAVVIEVSDRHPTQPIRARDETARNDSGGHGLQLISAVAESWGITYRRDLKTVWFRLPLPAPEPAARPLPETAFDGPPYEEAPYDESPYGEARHEGTPYDSPRPYATDAPAGPYDATTGPASYDDAAAAYADEVLQRGLRAAELLAPAPRRADRQELDTDRGDNGALSFLAEASDLLSGQLDADQVAALAAQLIVPRLADWCAVWLHDGDGGAPGRGIATGGQEQRLARVWHSSESRIDILRAVLEKQPPDFRGDVPPGAAPVAVPWPWPHDPDGERRHHGPPDADHPRDHLLGGHDLPEVPAQGLPDAPGRLLLSHVLPAGDGSDDDEPGGAALACPLVAGGRRLGTLLLGRGGLPRFPDEVVGLIEDLGRRVARAVATARAYSRQERISQVLQRRLLPQGRAQVPGVASAVVYEPREGAWAGGDFWDLFDAGDGRWCFALGDVCGSGPEAAAVTGLARPVLRLLARDGFGVAEVLDRLNKTMAREAADSVAAVAAAVAAAGAGAEAPVEIREEGEQARFLSLLYGEIAPYPDGAGGARCTLASAGHPLPLVLGTDGAVRTVAAPQMLLGVVEDAAYVSESFDLRPGETLLCVTDGVTERRSGGRLFDDEDGLATALAAGAGLGATALAEHLRTTVHAFAPEPPDDDLALLVLQAVGGPT
ncbi:SpoIIE family protein phosphatase [Streptomyces sp. NPDC059649]|uniref:SpoIIE family protein phosphatase n=1 Tax=Streptomyces sp. NPDC059649 TaxID=3346895 RepID=UPI00369823CB